MTDRIKIAAFYAFREYPVLDLAEMRVELKASMLNNQIRGTIILASEGFNGTICGEPTELAAFITDAERILKQEIAYKSSFSGEAPFRRSEVKLKPEIVTLKREIEIDDGIGSHIKPGDWNELILDPDVFLIDSRNDYEFKTGTFRAAVNPEVNKFSDLPDFIAKTLDPAKHKKVAMFCTGGIRCEKLAPYMKGLGFENVYQLEGGILKYLEDVPAEESLWEGECFVFDSRVSVDRELQKGKAADLSQRSVAAEAEMTGQTQNDTFE